MKARITTGDIHHLRSKVESAPDAAEVLNACGEIAEGMLELLDRLAGFASGYASNSAMLAGGEALVADARAIIKRAKGEGSLSRRARVAQDGAQFWDFTDPDHAFLLCTCPTPEPIKDHDLEGAKACRAWFLRWCEERRILPSFIGEGGQ